MTRFKNLDEVVRLGGFSAAKLPRRLAAGRARLLGVTVLPCALIEANGTRLLTQAMEQAARSKVDGAAVEWLRTECRQMNNLVDRIVPGPPQTHLLVANLVLHSLPMACCTKAQLGVEHRIKHAEAYPSA